MNRTIKPCPLCGGEAKLQKTFHYQDVRIYCKTCGLSTTNKSANETDKLVEYWNKRSEASNE